VSEKLDLILPKIERLVENLDDLHREQSSMRQELAEVRQGQSSMRMEMSQIQAAIFELLDGQKELAAGQVEIMRRVDMLAEMYGRHELDIRELKRAIVLKY